MAHEWESAGTPGRRAHEPQIVECEDTLKRMTEDADQATFDQRLWQLAQADPLMYSTIERKLGGDSQVLYEIYRAARIGSDSDAGQVKVFGV